MSNNIEVSQGSGKTVSTEEIGSAQYQRIKVVGGQTGSTSVMGVNPDGSINVSVIGALSAAISGGSVIAIPTGNQSVSGTVNANITGSVIAVVQGSVTAIATGNQSVSGTVDANIRGSIAAVIIGGSVAATFTPPANQSVSGAVTAPPGSVMAVRTDLASVIAVIQGSVAAAPMGNQSVSGATTAPPGSVTAVRTDNASVIAISTNVGSVITVNQSSSVIAVVTGSVVAIPQFSSVIAVPVGSTIAVLQAASIVATYAEDAAHGSADKGLFVLGVRNDLMASVTSADLDYSPISTGPVGEVLTANAPITKWIQGTADLRVVLGTSVAALAAQGTSVFTYVTAVQVANLGPSSVFVTFAGGLGSILGYTIAPAGGGSNIYYPNGLKTGANSQFSASLSGTASVLISAQGFNAKI